MSTKAKPGSVIAVLVLLILIAVYQLVVGAFALLGVLIETTDMLPQTPDSPAMNQIPDWALFTGVGIALVYGLAAVVLAVMVGKGNPTARPAALVVNAVYGVGILALVFTPIAGVMDVIAAVFAFAVITLLYSAGAKAYFGTAPTVGHPAGS